MIAVSRPTTPPAILQEKHAEWTESLCAARKAFYDAEDAWELAGRIGARPKKPTEADAKNPWYGHADIRKMLEEEMFHHKCAYCEGRVKGHSHLHIEHFRPQSIYPALAYEWHNILLACGVCNCKPYKEDRFPLGAAAVQAEPNRVNPCGGNGAEEVLLVNPCVDDPTEFFVWKFDENSVGKEVTPVLLARQGNLRGAQTIMVCGLDRVSLTDNHREKLGEVNTALSLLELAMKFKQEEKQTEALTKLRAFIAPQGVYSSMVRAYLEYRKFDFQLLTQSLEAGF